MVGSSILQSKWQSPEVMEYIVGFSDTVSLTWWLTRSGIRKRTRPLIDWQWGVQRHQISTSRPRQMKGSLFLPLYNHWTPSHPQNPRTTYSANWLAMALTDLLGGPHIQMSQHHIWAHLLLRCSVRMRCKSGHFEFLSRISIPNKYCICGTHSQQEIIFS